MPHLVIVAAGTGGHIMPGLAVAQEALARGWSVSWLGTTTGMENRLVPQAQIELDAVSFSGLRGKGLWHALRGAWQLAASVFQSLSILRRRRADAVLGMGGYVCVPAGFAAALLRRPLFLVNADAGLLMSNRVLLPVASGMALGFEGPAVQRAGSKARVTGNPVRQAIAALPVPAERFHGRSGPLRLLVVGGSLGARILNRTLPQALALWPTDREAPQVLHQTGQADAEAVRTDYAERGLGPDRVQVLPFIDDMAAVLAHCDVVVCRAGAITVSELCAAGVPSILIPLVLDTTAHQRDNATWMAEQGAALHVPQTELSPQRLVDVLVNLDRAQCQNMAERARTLARPQAAARVVDALDRWKPAA